MNSARKLLLCTDMDRTVLPNGVQPESPTARKRFTRFAAQPEVTLAYVTGRHRALVQQAIKNYALPMPEFAITDVGSRIYRIAKGEWYPLSAWEEHIAPDWGGKNHRQLRDLFRDIAELQLQETSKQNTFKLSYYIALHVDIEPLLALMQQRLQDNRVNASLVWSIDEPKGIGLLDVLPRNATKLHGIDFLRQQLGFDLDEMLFAGDSGNDLHVLASPIPSVLVANASEDVKQNAQRLAYEQQNSEALYMASGDCLGMNGNYAAGVLEGVYHFAPAFHEVLKAG